MQPNPGSGKLHLVARELGGETNQNLLCEKKKSIFNKMRNKETITFKQNNIKKNLEEGTKTMTLEKCCYWLALPV